jgi:hypothetical protein
MFNGVHIDLRRIRRVEGIIGDPDRRGLRRRVKCANYGGVDQMTYCVNCVGDISGRGIRMKQPRYSGAPS